MTGNEPLTDESTLSTRRTKVYNFCTMLTGDGVRIKTCLNHAASCHSDTCHGTGHRRIILQGNGLKTGQVVSADDAVQRTRSWTS